MSKENKNMYSDSKDGISNVFVGCEWDCIYCQVSFAAQMKRQKWNCRHCYEYIPHLHYKRLFQKLLATEGDEFIWLVRSGDPCFMSEWEFSLLLWVIEQNPDKTFLIQTKSPEFLKNYTFTDNTLLGITLETNRWRDYNKFSKAPLPPERVLQFISVKHSRKILTLEPILRFDLNIMIDWIERIKPERIYIGYNSKPKRVKLPEPSLEKTTRLIESLEMLGYKVKLKTMRERIEN